MLLSEDHIAVQDAVRSYVQDRIAPKAAEWDKTHHFPTAELRGLAELGCYGVAVPTEYDGAGLDYLALALILEEIAAGDGATSTVVSVNNCPVCSILMAWGNEAQKQAWLRPRRAARCSVPSARPSLRRARTRRTSRPARCARATAGC
jgi:Acyl-CoA dehydrogenases